MVVVLNCSDLFFSRKWGDEAGELTRVPGSPKWMG